MVFIDEKNDRQSNDRSSDALLKAMDDNGSTRQPRNKDGRTILPNSALATLFTETRCKRLANERDVGTRRVRPWPMLPRAAFVRRPTTRISMRRQLHAKQMPLHGAAGRAEANGHGIIPVRSREAVLGSISGADVLRPGFRDAGVRASEQLVIGGTAGPPHPQRESRKKLLTRAFQRLGSQISIMALPTGGNREICAQRPNLFVPRLRGQASAPVDEEQKGPLPPRNPTENTATICPIWKS